MLGHCDVELGNELFNVKTKQFHKVNITHYLNSEGVTGFLEWKN